MTFKHVLLASHGTVGSEAAVTFALQLCQRDGAALHHLVVVPEFWKGMMGDDWLNNGVSRDRFARYLESELDSEISQHLENVIAQAEQASVKYSHEIHVGEPTEKLIDVATQQSTGRFDLVVMGSSRPKKVTGLKSKIDLNKLSRELIIPFCVVPYPDSARSE